MLFAVLAARGEFYFGKGNTLIKEGREIEAFVYLIKADAIYPFKYYIRESNAALYGVADSLPPAVILGVIDEALKHDPYSANLLWYKIYNELKHGNLKEALPALLRMEQVSQDFIQTKNARRLYEAVEAKLKDMQRKDG